MSGDFRKCPVDRGELDYLAVNGGVYQCSECGFEFGCPINCKNEGLHCDDCSKDINKKAQKYVDSLIGEYEEENMGGNGKHSPLREIIETIKANQWRRYIKVTISEPKLSLSARVLARS